MIRNYKFHNPEGVCFVSFAKTFYEHTARSTELDEETGYYYYRARYYNPQIRSWLSVDPVAVYNPFLEIEHYIDGQHNGGVFNSGNLNVYGYTYQNPIIYIDPNGKQIVSGYLTGKILDSPTNGYSNLTKSGIHILNRVSGVKISSLQKVKITHSRKENFYAPYYDKDFTKSKVQRGLGAITLPMKNGKTIFFNKEIFKNWDVSEFLSLTSYEVGHLPQADMFNGNMDAYLLEFGRQYILSGTHDDVKFELVAEKGSTMFEDFLGFTNPYYGNGAFEKLYTNQNNSQNSIINRFDQWWKNYTKSPDYQKALKSTKQDLIDAYKQETH